MTTTTPAPRSAPSTASREGGTPILDLDIHEQALSLQDLLPYLDKKWHKHILQYHWTPERLNPFAVPSADGVNRADANMPDGRLGGMDLDLLRRHVFDDAGISAGVLVGRINASTLSPGWTEFKTALMSAYNDYQVEHWLQQDDRLYGSIHINAHDPAGAAREIERMSSTPHMVQVMMYLGPRVFGGPEYRPIYEAAARHGLAIGFHQSGNSPTTYGYQRYYVEWKTLVSQPFMSTLVSLIFNGVFDEFPGLKVILVEGGFTWLPHIMGRADQHYRQLRSEVPWLHRLPSDIIREQVKLTTQPIPEMTSAEFMKYIDLMGSDRLLCYSSDYPHWDFDNPAEALPSGLTEDLKERIFTLNACELYGERAPKPTAP